LKDFKRRVVSCNVLFRTKVYSSKSEVRERMALSPRGCRGLKAIE